jgi:hypothetical protein
MHMIGNMRLMPDQKIRCKQKALLLAEYRKFLGLHNNELKEYLELVRAGASRDQFAVIKDRSEKSEMLFTEAHRQYTHHIREHGCDGRMRSATA